MRQNNSAALVAIAVSLWVCSFSICDLQRAGAASYEEAKKEQEVVFYTSLNLEVAQPLGEAFSAKYPGVTVQVNRQGSDSLVPKLLTERRVAKKDSADVVLTGADSFDMMIMEVPDIFQKYASPERKPEEQGFYSAVYFTIQTIAYNTRAVSGADIPRRYTDLLRDRWKGKGAINLNNSSWIYSMLNFFGQEKGMDFLRKFAAQNPRPGRGTTLMVQQWLGGGEVEFALPLNHDGIDRFKKKGVPIDWARLEDPLYADQQTIAILGMARHPNAARLFVDFVLSKEGQTLLAKAGNSVMRDDIGINDGIDRKKLRFVSAEARTNSNQYQKIMDDLFSK